MSCDKETTCDHDAGRRAELAEKLGYDHSHNLFNRRKPAVDTTHFVFDRPRNRPRR